MTETLHDIDVTKKGVEVDAVGNPYYKWPPFPEPPDGVKITPFSEFKPAGIKISLGDEPEVDGLGIPTVRLPVMHDNEGPPKKKKKIKKTVTGEEILQRKVWWEEWEAGEAQRIRSAKIYDQVYHPKARVTRAVEEFKQVHDWGLASSRLSEWYQRLTYFLGLNEVSLRPRFHKQKQDDDYSDDDAAPNPPKGSRPEPLKAEPFDTTKHTLREKPPVEPDEFFRRKLERVRELQECRLEAFIENPHLAAKIFLSSYFRDSGMMWERMALRDAPRIFDFFLNYLLQTRALCEEEASLKLALGVARKAKEELPMTREIGQKMPDELASCLIAAFGSRLRKIKWKTDVEIDWKDEENAEFKAEVQKGGGEVISDTAAIPPSPDGSSAEFGATQNSQAEEATTGWGSTDAEVTAGWSTDALTKTDDAEDNPWAQPKTTASWTSPKIHSLLALLGPTSLPLTHTVGYVEESTRYIHNVTFPENSNSGGEGVVTPSDLLRNFAQVELRPYPSFAAPSAPHAAIQPPELLEDPWANISSSEDVNKTKPIPLIPRHDPTKDSITMLVDPELGKLLASCKRMGLGGTFVQIMPVPELVPDSNSNASIASVSSPSPDRGERQGHTSGGSHGRGFRGSHQHASKKLEHNAFWYAEKILQILPSYWTERQI